MSGQPDLPALALQLTQNSDNILALQKQISLQVAEFQNQLNAAQEQDTQLRVAILDAMEAAGGQPYEDENIRITYVKPTQRTGIDVTRLQLEQPEVFQQYKKITNVKSSIRIKVKE